MKRTIRNILITLGALAFIAIDQYDQDQRQALTS